MGRHIGRGQARRVLGLVQAQGGQGRRGAESIACARPPLPRSETIVLDRQSITALEWAKGWRRGLKQSTPFCNPFGLLSTVSRCRWHPTLQPTLLTSVKFD